MATDYHNENRSHAPDYRTSTGGSTGWLIGLAIAALLGLIAFFSFAGSDRPTTVAPGTTGTTSEQVVPPPAATETAPATQEQVIPVPPATTAPAQ